MNSPIFVKLMVFCLIYVFLLPVILTGRQWTPLSTRGTEVRLMWTWGGGKKDPIVLWMTP